MQHTNPCTLRETTAESTTKRVKDIKPINDNNTTTNKPTTRPTDGFVKNLAERDAASADDAPNLAAPNALIRVSSRGFLENTQIG